MLRRNITHILTRQENTWPVFSSLLLHLAVFSACCIPHAPKVHDCIMVNLEMPRMSSPGPRGETPAPRSKSAPTRKATLSAPPAAPTRNQAHVQTLPAKPRAVSVAEQKTSSVPQQTSDAPLVNRGTDSDGVAKGQVPTAAAQASGAGSGTETSKSTSNVSGGAGTGSTGSGGSNRPVDGVFGTQGGPAFINRVTPVYPRFAQRLGKEGTVLLRLTLDENGILKAVEVVEKAGHGFDEAATAAVRASRFRPAMHHGVHVASRALLPIKFEMKE